MELELKIREIIENNCEQFQLKPYSTFYEINILNYILDTNSQIILLPESVKKIDAHYLDYFARMQTITFFLNNEKMLIPIKTINLIKKEFKYGYNLEENNLKINLEKYLDTNPILINYKH